MTETFAFPLTCAQRGLWFLNELAPAHPFYNIHAALPLPWAIDRELLARAFEELVRRHETLRTTFEAQGSVPLQVVHAARRHELQCIELSQLDAAAREREKLRLATQEAQRPFQLGTEPLLRTVLLCAGPTDHVLLVTIHHIIADAWSMGVLFRELSAIYQTLLSGLPYTAEELDIQYPDYAVWEQELLESPRLGEHLEYFREQLRGFVSLQLPTDRPRPAVPTFQGASHSLRIPADIVRRLTALAREQNATLFMATLAAFKLLLSRYSGQDDIIIGGPTAGRHRTELEPLIGLFVNTLVLRTNLSGEPSFREAVSRVREVTLGAQSHRDLPFGKLVEALQPERDLSRNPFFQVTFQIQNQPSALVPGSADAQTPLRVQRASANFDLAFELWANGETLDGRIDYSSDLFDAASIARLASHYVALLDRMLEQPDSPAASLPLLSDLEQEQQLLAWNRTATPYPRDATLATLFEAQVARDPEAIALEDGTTQITYASLNERANCVAHRLRALDLRPEDRVAVCLPRSVECIVGLLAILKAGGSYLGIDPDWPESRLRLLLEDAQVRIVLCQPSAAARLGNLGPRTLALPLPAADAAAAHSGALAPNGDSGSLAYVAYTSGSTGQPKGVCVAQRAVARLVFNTNYAQFGPAQRWLQLAPLGFDASTLEIWGALLHGACLVLAPASPLSLEELGTVIRERRISSLWLTAGLFHQMVDHRLADLTGVSQLLTGGDVVSRAHVAKLLAAEGERAVINGYGPTEGTTFTCCYRAESSAQVGAFPIGRPCANTRVYVLDRAGQPVPINVAGELHIAGDGLARGYLNAPELTRARFIEHDITPRLRERLYRTGDLVRQRADGTIEFLGRLDRQLKVRGFRVEPAEIESVLSRAPAVARVAVIAADDPSGDRRLIAYIVPANPAEPPDVQALRSFAQQHLPGHMLPALFHVLSELPLTRNGKLDYAQLPQPGVQCGVAEERSWQEPDDEIERCLLALWKEVLELQDISTTDHFFRHLGGHSLLATQLVSRVRDAFQLALPLRAVFEAPRIVELARVIEQLLLDEVEALSDEDAQRLGSEALHGELS